MGGIPEHEMDSQSERMERSKPGWATASDGHASKDGHTMSTADQHQSELTASGPSENRLMKALLIAAITASALSMVFSVGTTIVSAQMTGSQVVASD